jgi:hypothetical protein
MNIQLTSVALADLEPALQQHIGSFSSPVDSFLEDHILASTHYQIQVNAQVIGWAAVHQQTLLTQFALLPAYRQLGQRVFAQARKLETVQAAFVPTCDEFFLAHALDDYRQLEKQAYFVSIQPPANLTGTFRGAVCLQVTSETWEYGKCRSSFVQPE